MEYLRQAPAKDARLFIWALESGRERYQSCHFILDQYFEDGKTQWSISEGFFLCDISVIDFHSLSLSTDAVCLVIKKMEDDENIVRLWICEV